VITEYNYLLFKDDGEDALGGYRVNVNDYMATPELTIDFPDMPHGRFYVLFYSLNDIPVDVDYTVEREVSKTLMDYMPLTSIAFVVINAAAAIYMMLMNRNYKAGIYQ